MTTTWLLEQWANAPGPEALRQLRDAIRAEPLYDPYRDLSALAVPLLDEGRFAQAKSVLLEVITAHALSPGAHALLARCHVGLGDDEQANLERALMRLSMQAILGSGDGSEARPYEVLYLSDEYDALQVLDFRHVSQATAGSDGGLVDVFTDAAGDTVRFRLPNRGRGR